MLTTSQLFTVLGLCFDFASGVFLIRKLFYGYQKRLGEGGQTVTTQIRKDRNEGALVLALLTIGSIFQVLAVFS